MFGHLGLVFTISIMPVQDLNALRDCCILFMGENRDRSVLFMCNSVLFGRS